MKCIVCATNKGGDGKTTTSINIAEYLALEKQKRGLLIDMDPQANLSSRYLKMEYDSNIKHGKRPPIHPSFDSNDPDNGEWDGRSTIADIFYGIGIEPYDSQIPNLEIAPSYSSKLQEAELVTKEEVTLKIHERLKAFINLKEVQARYDFIVIDTPPSKGPLTIASFKAATHVVIPAQMAKFSMDGIYGMLQVWKQETYCRSEENKIELVGILPNKYRDVNVQKHNLNMLQTTKNISEHVIPYKVHMRSIYSEILEDGARPKSIFELPEKHTARKETQQVCEYIYNKVFNHG